ncbi:MarR family protein [Krasilnikovia cinnamomea]|uniref:MarR family protein n=1 Tax=Krasilnikovia cinnamomea TaxID=349313 RepID=A0A4Q7ZGB0_9ACTN|nr:MarR family transcriptional regulator [Krasilnikovia cinnamomea]RZU49381.1 MarR family protein [Krasilnikovia cinnamomea]
MAAQAQPLDLGILLALAYQNFVRDLRSHLAEQGFDDLGRSDGFVFRALGASPMSISELAVRLEVTKQAAAQIVDDMQRRGYVRRTPDPHDRRAQRLELTDRGAAALAAARQFHQRYERRLARAHGAAAMAALRDVLNAVAGGPDETLAPRLRAMYL